MLENIRSKPLAIILTCIALLQSDILLAAQLAVRRTEGLVHGFLLLSTMEGKPLADGDLIQVSRGNRVPATWCSDLRTARSTMKPQSFLSAATSDS
jgi:hypothetical protein